VLDYRKRKVMEFDQLRNQMGLSTSNPSPVVARGGAWHLTSFGDMDTLQRKLTTFGAANKFDKPGALDRTRVEACIAGCWDFLYNKPVVVDGKHKEERGTITPCLQPNELNQLMAAGHRRHLPHPHTTGALSRHFELTQPLPWWGGAALPTYLISHPEEFPKSWFTHLGRPSPPKHGKLHGRPPWTSPPTWRNSPLLRIVPPPATAPKPMAARKWKPMEANGSQWKPMAARKAERRSTAALNGRLSSG